MFKNWIARLLIAYGGFTAAMWMVSECMIDSGANYPRNPAWVLVSGLRDAFTFPIEVVAVVAGVAVVVGGIIWLVMGIIDSVNDAKETARRREEAERQARYMESSREARANHEAREQERRRNQALLEEKRKEEERLQEIQRKLIEKQKRSPEDAAKSALDDF